MAQTKVILQRLFTAVRTGGWREPVLVVFTLLVLFPVGLWLLWRRTEWSDPVRWFWTGTGLVAGLVIHGRLWGLQLEEALRALSQQNIWVGVGMVIAATAIAVALLLFARKYAPRGGFFSDGSRTAAIFGTTWTMFSVLLALVVLLSVETYRSTESHTNAEADAVLQQFQLATLFASADRLALQSELVCYGRSVSELEWTVIRDEGASPAVDGWARSIDDTVEGMQIQGSKAEAGFQSFLAQNLERQEERRGRIEGGTGTLPSVVWPVLLLGAVATVSFLIAYADRREKVVSQVFQVGVVTFVLGTSLLLINALDHPFGNIPGRIEPTRMAEANEWMEKLLAETIDAPGLEAVLPCDEDGAPRDRVPAQVDHPEGSTMAAIVDRGQITVGVTHGLPLFGEIDPLSGELSGFDVDLAREIARELGLGEDQVAFQNVPVPDRMQALEAGEVDMVVLAMTITPERAARVSFSEPYYVAGQSIMVHQTNRGITNTRDLREREVCVVPGSTSAHTLADLEPDIELVFDSSFGACVVSLRNGYVDAVSTDDIVLAGFAAEDEELILVGGQFSTEPYGVAVAHEDADLAEFVNGVVGKMIDDGRWGRIYFKYLGGIPGIAPVEVAKQSVTSEEATTNGATHSN